MVTIVYVNYKTPDLLQTSIRSVYQKTTEFEPEIIVVDNNSNDSSKELILNKFKDVVWIQNETNEGFGRANNMGIQGATNDFVLLLNTDTILHNNAIEILLEYYKNQDEKLGLLTARLFYEDLTIQKSTYSYNASFYELFTYNIALNYLGIRKKNSKEIKAINGACIFFNKQRVKTFFDPDFFMYAEEFEWCNRITSNGLKLGITETAEIIHLEGRSNNNKEWNIMQRYASQALLFRKKHGFFGLLLYFFIMSINYLTNFLFLFKMDNNYKANFSKIARYHKKLFKYYYKIFLKRYEIPLFVKI